jgi:hypothetical protein
LKVKFISFIENVNKELCGDLHLPTGTTFSLQSAALSAINLEDKRGMPFVLSSMTLEPICRIGTLQKWYDKQVK